MGRLAGLNHIGGHHVGLGRQRTRRCAIDSPDSVLTFVCLDATWRSLLFRHLPTQPTDKSPSDFRGVGHGKVYRHQVPWLQQPPLPSGLHDLRRRRGLQQAHRLHQDTIPTDYIKTRHHQSTHLRYSKTPAARPRKTSRPATSATTATSTTLTRTRSQQAPQGDRI